MSNYKILLLPMIVLLVVFAAGSTAQAQTAIVTENNNCLIPEAGTGYIKVQRCTTNGGGDIYSINNGFISTQFNGRTMCFDHGIPRRSSPVGEGAKVKLVDCQARNQSQVWYIIADGSNVGLIQNAVNPDVCLNIAGGADWSGGQVVVYNCGFGNPGRNERFYIGSRMSAYDIGNLDRAIVPTFNANRMVTFDNGARIVSQGGGNIASTNGANIVSQGGGNIIAAGPASIVSQGGGNLAGSYGNRHVQSVGSTAASSVVASSKGHRFH